MDLSRSVQATIKYAEFFNFPLTSEEIHFWLISPISVSVNKIHPHLPSKMTLRDRKLRTHLSLATQEKVHYARTLANKLRFVPGLRMVALTGSVAANNSHPSDDIDLFFITTPHTLWLVRPLVLFVISVFFRRRHPGEDHAKATNAFCPNLWMDSVSVSVPSFKQNLYTAHEVLQVVPLLDRGHAYQHFLYQNRWVKKYLANAYASLASIHKHSQLSETWNLKSEIIKFIFAPLNYLSYLIQLLYMYPKKTTETVHLHAAYLHTTDFASQINHHLESLEV